MLNATGATISGAITATSGSFTGDITTNNISATAGTVGGWTLTSSGSTRLYAGTGTTFTGLIANSASSSAVTIFAGATNNAGLSPLFSVTNAGYLTASSGLIGGFTLASDRLTNLGASKYAGIIDTALDTDKAFFAGATDTAGLGATFAVTNAGAVTASNITATGGTIGGWTLASTPSRLHAGSGSAFVGLSADTTSLATTIFAGATDNTGFGAKFKVLNDGSVTASNLSITGGPSGGNVISVNSGTFSVTSAGAMTATSANVTGTISTSNITATGGFIGGWTLNSTSLTNSGGSSGQYAGILDTPSAGLAFFAGATDNVGASAKFSVTNDGAITATSGTIGGYTIASDRLTNNGGGTAQFSGLIDTPTTGLAFFAGATDTAGASAKFTVTNAGEMTATSGLIGGYTLASDRLTNASTTGSVKYAGLIDTADATGLAFFAGATGNDGAGATFAVTNAGALSASSVSITGGSITIGIGSLFSVTSDGQVAAKGGYFDPIDTGTLFRPAVVVAGNTTQGDIAAANGGTLNLGVTSLGATGTAATGQFTNVLQMTSSIITANKTLYIGSANTSTTGLSFKQNRGHIAPYSDSSANSSIGIYTDSGRGAYGNLVAEYFFPGGQGSARLGHNGNFTMNDSLDITGSLTVTGRVSQVGADSTARNVPFMFYGKTASATTTVPGEGGIYVTVSYTGETGATPLVVIPTIQYVGSPDDKLVASVYTAGTASASIRISNTNEGIGSDSGVSRQVWLIGYTAS